jgi:UDP-N-acetylmuramoyl-tripeptide--D-alanyl-D-alanine ligase
MILVSDTTKAYQDLAAYYRQKMNPYVIGVTGSVGKTSLKDMLGDVFRMHFQTVATEKNFNNHIGLPKTIFDMDTDTEILICEMGMDKKGEIALLVDIAKPDVGLISNIGISHRENFDDDDGIFRAKLEMTNHFDAGNLLVVNGDDAKLKSLTALPGREYRILTAGTTEGCDYRILNATMNPDATISFDIRHKEETVHFEVCMPGLYNSLYAGMTAAIAAEHGISLRAVADAVKHISRTAHRLQIVPCGMVTVIDDSYNASPDSMGSGLETLVSITGKRKIAILAGMNELGEDSENLHREVGKNAVKIGVDVLIAVGEKGTAIAEGARAENRNKEDKGSVKVIHLTDNAETILWIKENALEDDVYLLKGSNSMRMWDIVDEMKEVFES